MALLAVKPSMAFRVALNLILTAGIIFLSSIFSSAYGVVTCRSVHGPAGFASLKANAFKKILAEKLPLLREQGFDVDKEGYLRDTRASTPIRISKLDVIEPPHLYEWASGEHHEAWVANGRISASEMRDILRSAPQFTGRGFYVSTNPFNSSNFGTHMTVFQPQGPLLVIDGTSRLNSASFAEVTRMQQAGIDAVRNPLTPTWLAVISSKHLKIDERPLIDPQFDLIASLKEKPGKVFQAVQKWTDQGAMDRISTSSILGRLWRNQSSAADQSLIYDLIVVQGFEAPVEAKNQRNPLSSRLMAAAATHVERRTGPVRSADELLPLLQFAMKTSDYWRADARALQNESEYGRILNYFDLKTLALLNRGVEVKEIPDLAYVKDATAQLTARRQKIDITKIATIKGFLKAASTLLGKPINFRDHDVIMSSEEAVANSHLITLSAETAQVIQANRLLDLYDQQKPKRDGRLQTGIAYTSIKTMQDLVSQNQISLPTALRDRLLAVKPSASGTYRSEESKAVYREVLEHLIQKLIEDNGNSMAHSLRQLAGKTSDASAYDLYRAFMSLHPFSDGNGRSGRIFYELMALRFERIRTQLELPIFDLDLLGVEPPAELLMAGSFLRSWASQARSDAEFLQRSDVALETLVRYYPRLKNLFPEIALLPKYLRSSQPLVLVGSTCRYCSSSKASGLAVQVSTSALNAPRSERSAVGGQEKLFLESKVPRMAVERLDRSSSEKAQGF